MYKILEGQNSSVEYEKLLQLSVTYTQLTPLVEGTVVLLLQMFGGQRSDQSSISYISVAYFLHLCHYTSVISYTSVVRSSSTANAQVDIV